MSDRNAEVAAAVVAYLQEHAPEIASMVLKDGPIVTDQLDDYVKFMETTLFKQEPSAGDVHTTTALGNEKGSKAISFMDALPSYQRRPKKIPDAKPKTVLEKLSDWSIPLDIVKAQPDQQLVFGWASVSTKNGLVIVDKQGDMILPEDLEKAAYDFVLYCRSQGDMHKTNNANEPVQVGRLVESMMFTKEKQDVLKINLGLEGWWVGFKVDDPALWEAHKRGDRPEFSIGGKGKRVDATE